uniref:Uncharacterized protein n=1 Tax=Arundo donax TaxID=35708 RepID=A0A0A9HIC3_ARUDO
MGACRECHTSGRTRDPCLPVSSAHPRAWRRQCCTPRPSGRE